MLFENERLESLGGGVSAIVSPDHTFGADAILLAHFAAVKASGRHLCERRLCELGTGCGIIPLLCRKNGLPDIIDAYEISSEAADIARRAVELNGLEGVNIINSDLRLIDTAHHGSYDVVVSNPPYKKLGEGAPSSSKAALVAHHESECTLEDVIKIAQRLLKPGGRLYLCHRPERLTELLTLMRCYQLEPKRMRFAQQNTKKAPWLVLIEGRKAAKPGLIVEPALLAEENGVVSPEMCEIYGEYK